MTNIVSNNMKRHWAGKNGRHLLSEWRGRCRNLILNTSPAEDFFPNLSRFSFYCYDGKSPLVLSMAILIYLLVLFECFGLVNEIYSRGDPSSYVYCVVYFSRVLYNLNNELECSWVMIISMLSMFFLYSSKYCLQCLKVHRCMLCYNYSFATSFFLLFSNQSHVSEIVHSSVWYPAR